MKPLTWWHDLPLPAQRVPEDVRQRQRAEAEARLHEIRSRVLELEAELAREHHEQRQESHD